MTVRVIGPRDPRVPGCVNTTSNSENWSRGLSPFYLGPVPLYPGSYRKVSQTMENAWQYAKCYPCHVGVDGLPTPEYYEWAGAGWDKRKADRYPMGKGAKPSYCWWGGEKLPYLEARKRVYIPPYAKAVVQTEAFAQLLDLYRTEGHITLWDFDGYDHLSRGKTLKEVINDPNKTMGHAFILAYLLEGLVGKLNTEIRGL